MRAIDVLIIIATGYIAGFIVFANKTGTVAPVYQFLTIFCAFYAFTLFEYFKLYLSWRGKPVVTMCAQVLGAWGSVWLVGIFTAYLLHLSGDLSRAWALIWLTSAGGLLALSRVVSQLILQRIRSNGLNKKSVFIVGYDAHGQEFHRQSEKSSAFGYRVIGCYDSQSDKTLAQIGDTGPSVPLLNQIATIRPFLAENKVDEVWLTLSLDAYAEMKTILAQLHALPVEIRWMPDASMMSFISHRTSEIFGHLTIDMNHTPAPGVQGYLKEVFDRSLATFLTLLASPTLIALALAVRVSSPGPVFYGHTRIGANGKRFKVYKFRSMVTNSQEVLEHLLATDPVARAEWEADHKLRNDPRITKIGKFLRATSLDELPQLFNVIRGEMSLVGPRPIVDAEVIKYGNAIHYYYAARPGITGLWQVSGRNDVTYTSRVRLDAHYVMTWSLMRDLTILFRTIGVVFGRKGAY
ncbi:sugar transferase [Robbsia sp. KACC 23696]|uniref:sugar transferase n=1 Tax=Robbsia sp. KACC 23696 TaxID=3149231 RepID=UPI00325B0838